ncbi:hypothetical protein MKUB_13110 [Mycobacterium kubicae]|uniref:DUF222 domain-containing protein n=1 Tax=Mycobacterium kubicae TaxID=120959 RepID=A0AAX1JCI6_9MYCO|nr:hypothetical protein [Mycobacterium kubicae]MCV7096681.1 hypothetical protein [Mycobacterium kubicae]ORW04241.1 hypothetical protein AWC13_00745 [Mycobacterium kubicae]QNI11052.1 hypothetical protein GAN18_07400 [Mycobacterium kubicae]QPI39264.1 hypothetical protein I2456_07265 [Mycobacterium kubicae]GFG63821.1 hypothetical protein MKUB_13110 [Mycobacterium kubicae]
MNDRTAALDHADRLLEGEYGLGGRGPLIAALLARSALEDWLDEQSASWTKQAYGFPTTRSKLVALGALRGTDLGEQAKRVWHGLSLAVHRHAYELQPSLAEIRHLVGAVRDLQQQ